MIGHLYSVLRHNQLSDFLSLPQFFFEQFAVFICIGDFLTEVVRLLTVSAVVDAAVGSTLCLHSFALIQRCFEVEQYIVGSLPN